MRYFCLILFGLNIFVNGLKNYVGISIIKRLFFTHFLLLLYRLSGLFLTDFLTILLFLIILVYRHFFWLLVFFWGLTQLKLGLLRWWFDGFDSDGLFGPLSWFWGRLWFLDHCWLIRLYWRRMRGVTWWWILRILFHYWIIWLDWRWMGGVTWWRILRILFHSLRDFHRNIYKVNDLILFTIFNVKYVDLFFLKAIFIIDLFLLLTRSFLNIFLTRSFFNIFCLRCFLFRSKVLNEFTGTWKHRKFLLLLLFLFGRLIILSKNSFLNSLNNLLARKDLNWGQWSIVLEKEFWLGFGKAIAIWPSFYRMIVSRVLSPGMNSSRGRHFGALLICLVDRDIFQLVKGVINIKGLGLRQGIVNGPKHTQNNQGYLNHGQYR